MSTLNLRQVRHALTMALALLDQLESKRGQRIDQGVLDLLGDCPDGLSTTTIARLLRRRRQDVLMTLRLLEQTTQIQRTNGRWGLVD